MGVRGMGASGMDPFEEDALARAGAGAGAGAKEVEGEGDLVVKRRSEKSYVVSVCLSAVFGMLGVQHFYLGRLMEGLADVTLTAGWVFAFATERPLLGVLFFGLDFLHSMIVTILLLTGSFKDGGGAYVCYPGQKLK